MQVRISMYAIHKVYIKITLLFFVFKSNNTVYKMND